MVGCGTVRDIFTPQRTVIVLLIFVIIGIHIGSAISISYGDIIQGSIASVGEFDNYTFTGVADEHILATIHTDWDYQPSLQLYGTNGTLLSSGNEAYYFSDLSFILPESGEYLLMALDKEGSNIGNYSIYLQRVNNPILGDSTPIHFGDMFSASLAQLAETDVYTFTANAEDIISAKMASSWGSYPELRLYAQNGTFLQSVWGSSAYTDLIQALSVSGTYTLMALDRNGDETGNYSLFFQRTNNPANQTAINFGNSVNGSIDQLAEFDTYTFAATAGDIVYARSTSSTNQFIVWLFAPNGTFLAGGPEITSLLPASGQYTLLTGDDNGQETGPYALYLQRTNNPVGGMLINFGESVTGSLTEGADMDAYTFSAQEGSPIHLVIFPGPLLDPAIRIIDSQGILVFGYNGAIDMHWPPPGTGDYTLLVGDIQGNFQGTYDIFLQNELDPGFSITGPSIITSPGRYLLKNDIYVLNTGFGIDIQSSDVILEGNGYTLGGADTPSTFQGIRISGGSEPISNVTIVNLTITDWSYGISAENTANIQILRNNISSNIEAVHIVTSPDTSITNNEFIQNTMSVISVANVPNITIQDNLFEETPQQDPSCQSCSIYLGGSENSSIRNNSVTGGCRGMCILDTVNLSISDNLIIDGVMGITVGRTTDANLTNNQVINISNGNGIHLHDSSHNFLLKNYISNVTSNGLYLQSSRDTRCSDNHITNTSYGIYLYDSADNLLSYNNVSNSSQDGILLYASSNRNNLLGNSVSGNGERGISIYDTDNHLVTDNTITNNNYTGLYIAGSNNNILKNNTVQGNGEWGIIIADWGGWDLCWNNTLTNNTISENKNGVLLLASAQCTLEKNYIFDNEVTGIEVSSSEENSIYNNYFQNQNNIKLSESENNRWNISPENGPNIMGGQLIGGNFWGNFSGSGFSQTCNDEDLNGFCDEPFYIDSDDIDWYPLSSVQPDLVVQSINCPSQVDSLENLNISWTIKNQGNSPAIGTWEDAIYLSLDTVINETDILIGSQRGVFSLDESDTYTSSVILIGTPPIEPGRYHLLIKTDWKDELPEAREWNNIFSLPIFVGSGTEFSEAASLQSDMNVEMLHQNISLTQGTVTGDFTGTFDLNSLDKITIQSGTFEGQGFFTGEWIGNLDGTLYNGFIRGTSYEVTDQDSILVKGIMQGAEINGLFEGYLRESNPGSGDYDIFSSDWKINKLHGDSISATIHTDGSLLYRLTESLGSVPIQVIQTNLNGNVWGDYNNPVSVVLTHIHINDSSNPQFGKGFSILSYSSSMGSGDGWTSDSLSTSGTVIMEGLFSAPLFGLVHGTLTNDTGRSLSIMLERVDKALPPMSDLSVSIWGPASVSPGQTVDYLIGVRSDGFVATNNVVVVDALPHDFQYVSSSSGGIYRWENHEVFWKFDSLPPRSIKYVTVKGYVPWGISGGVQLNHTVYVETTDYERDIFPETRTALCDLNQYLTYQSSNDISLIPTTDEEYQLIKTNQTYIDLFSHAQAQGYSDTNFTANLLLNDGSTITASFLMKTQNDVISSLALVSQRTNTTGFSSGWVLLEFSNSSLSLSDLSGGILFNITDQTTTYLGNWGEAHSCPYGTCWWNCAFRELPQLLWGCLPGFKNADKEWKVIADAYKKTSDVALATPDCQECFIPPTGLPGYRHWESCISCIGGYLGISEVASLPVCGISVLLKGTTCHQICAHQETFSEEAKEFTCINGTVRKRCSRWWNIGDWPTVLEGPHLITERCTDCRWQFNGYVYCEKNCDCITNPYGQFDSWCDTDCKNPNKGSLTPPTTITVARDPNIKYGPEGHVLAGQTLDYRIEYENGGEGIAFGVYFIDTLDEDLDDTTLNIGPVYSTIDSSQIAPAGTYNPGTRTITWLVGEVGPQEGGYANISINVRSDAPDETEIINYGIVYFPSVPEETKTNAIVSVVGINHPPEVPSNPLPADAAANVSHTTALLWTETDPDGDTLRYDISFGTTTPPPLVEHDSFSTIYDPGLLEGNTTYSWQIVARDPEGLEVTGPVWNFTTTSAGPQVIPFLGYTNPPSDPDTDTLYEDLNGNGRKDFADVVLYFEQMDWVTMNEPISAFDFNSNGRIDFNDIVRLFEEI